MLPDIAYHRDKFARGYELLIDVWGADHHGYVSRMRAGMQALGHQPDELEIILGQLVHAEARAARRSGSASGRATAIWLDELLDEVGADAARLTFLLQSMDSRQTFDIDVVTSTASDNPVFYVQYANARIHSIGRKAAERSITRAPLAEVDLSVLVHPRELEILRVLFALPGADAGGLHRTVAAPDRHLGPRAGRRRSTASTTTATSCPTTSTSRPARPGCGWSRRRSSASRSRPTCWV